MCGVYSGWDHGFVGLDYGGGCQSPYNHEGDVFEHVPSCFGGFGGVVIVCSGFGRRGAVGSRVLSRGG